MKNRSIKLRIAITFGVAVILAIFITRPAFSQSNAKKESTKKIMVKVVSDDNGKTTVIDTTMEMPDSAMIDSIRQEIEKVIELGSGDKHCRMKMQKMPGGFSYNFDMPCPPECPMDLEELAGMDFEGIEPGREMEEYFGESREPGIEKRMMRMGGHGQTLNDLLGDIPMDRVVSYSIKDRKGGKRITIDLSDAPTFENQERVVVIREPGRMQHGRHNTERNVRVYVNTDDDKQSEKTPEQQSAPKPKTK